MRKDQNKKPEFSSESRNHSRFSWKKIQNRVLGFCSNPFKSSGSESPSLIPSWNPIFFYKQKKKMRIVRLNKIPSFIGSKFSWILIQSLQKQDTLLEVESAPAKNQGKKEEYNNFFISESRYLCTSNRFFLEMKFWNSEDDVLKSQ